MLCLLTGLQGWESFCGGISDGFARMVLGNKLMLHSLFFSLYLLSVILVKVGEVQAVLKCPLIPHFCRWEEDV